MEIKLDILFIITLSFTRSFKSTFNPVLTPLKAFACGCTGWGRREGYLPYPAEDHKLIYIWRDLRRLSGLTACVKVEPSSEFVKVAQSFFHYNGRRTENLQCFTSYWQACHVVWQPVDLALCSFLKTNSPLKLAAGSKPIFTSMGPSASHLKIKDASTWEINLLSSFRPLPPHFFTGSVF